MCHKICGWILYTLLGWKKDVTVHHSDKYIICLAPHTSNLDFIIGQLYMRAERMKVKFMMKKEWFFWPLGFFFRKIGGVPVWRNKHCRMTDLIADIAYNAETFHLCITPEGTRSANPEWKRGFYYIALKAQIPILLYGLDYGRKLIQCNKYIIPDGDIDKDMSDIKSYFKKYKGRHPENFTTGD